MDEQQYRKLQDHLEKCPSCAAELEALRQASSLFAAARTPAPEPAADLWSRVEAQILSEQQPASQPAAAPGRSRGWARQAGTAVAAASLAVAGYMVLSTGMFTYQPTSEEDFAEPPAAEAPQAEQAAAPAVIADSPDMADGRENTESAEAPPTPEAAPMDSKAAPLPKNRTVVAPPAGAAKAVSAPGSRPSADSTSRLRETAPTGSHARGAVLGYTTTAPAAASGLNSAAADRVEEAPSVRSGYWEHRVPGRRWSDGEYETRDSREAPLGMAAAPEAGDTFEDGALRRNGGVSGGAGSFGMAALGRAMTESANSPDIGLFARPDNALMMTAVPDANWHVDEYGTTVARADVEDGARAVEMVYMSTDERARSILRY